MQSNNLFSCQSYLLYLIDIDKDLESCLCFNQYVFVSFARRYTTFNSSHRVCMIIVNLEEKSIFNTFR